MVDPGMEAPTCNRWTFKGTHEFESSPGDLWVYEFEASLGSRVNPQARGRKRKRWSIVQERQFLKCRWWNWGQEVPKCSGMAVILPFALSAIREAMLTQQSWVSCLPCTWATYSQQLRRDVQRQLTCLLTWTINTGHFLSCFLKYKWLFTLHHLRERRISLETVSSALLLWKTIMHGQEKSDRREM